MAIYSEKQILSQTSENGIWLDYTKDTWLFFIKDDVWQPEEIQRTKHADVTVSFIQRGITDAFLLEIFDCLEVSDLPFCIKEAEDDVIASLNTKEPYHYEIVLVNAKNEVCAVRDGSFSPANSRTLKECLKKRMQDDFTVSDAEASYQKLMKKFEPYELEESAVFVQKN